MPGVCFEIPGRVQPWQRAGRGGNGAFYTKQPTRTYEKLVAQCALLAMRGRRPFVGYISLHIAIMVEIPRSWRLPRVQAALAGDLMPVTGDIDNMVKALADGMNEIVYADDRQIVDLEVRRSYSDRARAIVSVAEVASAIELDAAHNDLIPMMRAI